MKTSRQHSGRRLSKGQRRCWAYPFGAALAGAPILVAVASQAFPPASFEPGRIVYTRAATNSREFAIDIYLADANGDNEQRLTNTVDAKVYGSAAGEDQPRWSPDGQEIAFSTINGDGAASIWRVAVSGGTPTPLALNDGDVGGPAWQPDGQCVVFAGAHRGGSSTLDLRRACRDGTVSTVLHTADVDERSPDVSADGTKIVYQARRPPRSYSDRPDWVLRLVNVDGSNDRLLYAPPHGSATFPRWSPDMARIAFVRGATEGYGSLAVLELASGRAVELATKAAGPIAWSPDGQKLLFHNVDASGPRLLTTAHLAGNRPAQEPQYKGLYLLDGSIGQLWRLRGPAGGEGAGALSYQWGYAPDWYSASPTPTSTATATATATASPTATDTPTATATAVSRYEVYLPLLANAMLIGGD